MAAPRPGRGPSIQARTRMQDAGFVATRYECGFCQITYYVSTGRRTDCPLCSSEEHNRNLSSKLSEAQAKIAYLEENYSRLRVVTDLGEALRQSIDVMETDDLSFLKSACYRYRADRSVMLTPVHGRGGMAVGIMVHARGVPETHMCSSIGGVAFSGLLDEAVRTQSVDQAMKLVMYAMGKHLAPGRVS